MNIKQLLNSDDSVLVFDIDGVLAVMEFGNHNHFMTDEEWDNMIINNINTYTEDKVSKKMQDFLKTKDKNKIYVVSKVNGENEIYQKMEYANKYYEIPKENVICVNSEYDKADELNKIKEKNPSTPDEKIIMIDDTVEVLNDIMEKTNFSTIHISSFLDI